MTQLMGFYNTDGRYEGTTLECKWIPDLNSEWTHLCEAQSDGGTFCLYDGYFSFNATMYIGAFVTSRYRKPR